MSCCLLQKRNGKRVEKSHYVEVVCRSLASYGEVVAKCMKALDVEAAADDEEEEEEVHENYVLTTPAGIVISHHDSHWTLGSYKAQKRPIGQLRVGLCRKVSMQLTALHRLCMLWA